MSVTINGTNGVTYNDGSLQSSAIGKNLIINGNMAIAQRGTSFTGVSSSGYYTLDRFQVSVTPSTSAWTVTQSTDVPSGQGFTTSLKCDCTTAFSSYTGGQSATITHVVEAQNLQYLKVGTSSAESLTLSFWVKSNTTGNYVAWLYTPDGTARHTNKVFTINTADTWEKKTITVSGDTAGSINNDSGHGMYMRVILASGSGYTSGTSPDGTWEDASNTTNWYAGQTVNLSSSTSNYINITGVQLEVGTTATPFENLQYGQQLALCQRYYYKWDTSSSNNWVAWAMAANTTNMYGHVPFPTTMRSNPSSIDYSGMGWWVGGAVTVFSAVAIAESGTDSCTMNFTSTGLTSQKMYGVLPNGSTNYIAFNSEL